MSRTLKLVDRLLALGRNLHTVGRNQEALAVLRSLAGFRELPPVVAEETQARLAEIQLRRCRFRRARRHLRAALHYQPDSARYHYLLATTLAADEKADPQRAIEHYRKSLELDPKQPLCLCDLGLLALRLDQTEEGLKALQQAVELAPADPEVLAALLHGLCQANRAEDARRAVHAALFRHPRDRRFTKLWREFQFRQLWAAQQNAKQTDALDTSGEERAMVLPFVRPAAHTVATSVGPKFVRQDAASAPPPPHISRPRRLLAE